ncbi:glycoside hydrolase family 61 protein [Exserohilum turcica Et28A]|uniref:lytic cellulose monooxygenase (C4-dehydrogenating) n=1 Tax=Exserohilum turcicum (strain 28A) TaxID=671987 RepID=R0I7Z5_EXST2|nr:glycoside hydrolase family 61 protein [Exserohilum turcica Et28A]EOA81556.1 glycoside hydrolase family 61 protein [Exserohilum turcica Et28A]
MAKVPEGKTAATWDGSGEVWFKVSSEKAEITNGQIDWPSHGRPMNTQYSALTLVAGKDKVSFKTPSTLPKGEYLLRIEHIALHSASSVGGAQFYISCAQVNVEGSGTGNPGPKVAFPGAYKATDPGVQVNIYYPVPTNYAPPGPAVWLG